jgi:hypothetical protein
VDAAVAPARVLLCQAQHQPADGADGARTAGRPGRELEAWRRASRSRCQRSTVSGRISSRNLPSMSRGSRCSRAARNARSTGENRGRALPSCRSSTMSWWRSARIPRPCPGRSPEEAAVTRTHSSQLDRPVEAAQPIIIPQQQDLRRATS